MPGDDLGLAAVRRVALGVGHGVALAFVATAVSSLFAQAMLVRYTRDHRPQDGAWTLALAMFALASAALATGTATGWDNGTFRVFYLFGAVLDVPVARPRHRLPPRRAPTIARRGRSGLLVLLAASPRACCSARRWTRSHGTAIPVGKDVFGALPARARRGRQRRRRAVVIIGGAVVLRGPLRP